MHHATRSLLSGVISVAELRAGNRRALAKAITLAESTNPAHSVELGNLLREVHTTSKVSMIPRIAFSGSPGAGKSTLLEVLGYHLCEKLKLKVGILAVDPTSTLSRGSILGDKTRMAKLSEHANSYIRPSPSGGHLGGVTARAWEVMELFEAANFDVIFIETVGVGQSETQCKDITDLMVLLVPPASGDELQGIKKGIVEVSDVIIVTKNDGSRKLLAQQTKAAYASAVMYTELEQGFAKPVIAVSAEDMTNVTEAWDEIMKMWNARKSMGQIEALRRSQSARHFMNYFELELLARAKRMARNEITRIASDVWHHRSTPREAGDLLVNRCLRTTLAAPEVGVKSA